MKPEGGGPAQGIRNSIPEMNKYGVINEVVCFDRGDESYCGSDRFKIYYLGAAKGPYQYHSGLKDWLFSNIGNYDAVVVHGLWLHNSYGTFQAWRAYKKKYLKAPRLFVMPHGMLDPYFQKAKDRKLKAIRNSIFWHLLEKHVLNNADGVLFTCEQELLLARETFWDYHPLKEINVSYGVPQPSLLGSDELDLIFQNKFPLLLNQPYWLFLSRIHEKKGVDLLLTAYLRLKKENKFIPNLVIAGPGTDTEYGKALLKIVNGDPKIHFIGMVKEGVKWAIIQNASFFILPSHQENFGIAIVEALACGKPVMITDRVNIYKEIQKAQAGLIVKDNLNAVLEGLKKLVSFSEEETHMMSQRATELYQQKFSIKESARRFTDMIKSEIAKR